MIVLYALAAIFGLGVLWLGTNLRVIKQYERGVVYRFGRVQSTVRGPGLTWLIPIADRLDKVNMQIITMPIPAQDGITRDNVTVRVDAVIYFNVAEPVRAAVAPWPEPDPGALAVMRRVKERFDPARIFSPGTFVGGI